MFAPWTVNMGLAVNRQAGLADHRAVQVVGVVVAVVARVPLCALEGAVQNIRWHNLNKETKEDLKEFFNSFQ